MHSYYTKTKVCIFRFLNTYLCHTKPQLFLIGIATIMGHRTKPCASGGYAKPMGFDSPFFGFGSVAKLTASSGFKLSGNTLKISNPYSINKTSFGFSDKVPGSIYRTGRGPLKDFATQKPILSPMNSHKYNKFGRWSIGIGTSGASGYYFYKKLYK